MPFARRRITSALTIGLVLFGACKDSVNNTEPEGSLTMTLTPQSGSVVKGNSIQSTIAVVRHDYSGGIDITLEGTSTNISGSVGLESTDATTTTAVITFATTANAVTGTYDITVRVKGEAGITDVTKVFTLTVTAPVVNNNVTLDASACAFKPIWLAAQDGNGAFTRIVPAADVYQFQVAGSTATVAWVSVSVSGGYVLSLNTWDRSKWVGGAQICSPPQTTMTATIAGMPANTYTSFALSNGGSGNRTSNGLLTMTNVRAGTSDIYAFLRGVDAANDRFIFRRAQTIAGTGDLGTFDFNGLDAYAAANATLTITGLTGGETPGFSMFYHNTVGGKCGSASLYFRDPPTATFTASGIPTAQQQPTDYHEAFVVGYLPSGEYRGVGQVFHTMGPRSIALPTALPALTFTQAGGSLYRRMQTQIAVPTDYAGEVLLQFFQNGSPSRSVQFRIQTTNTAGSTINVAMPDFSGVSGWDPAYGQSTTTGGQWNFYAYNDATGCTEGNRLTFSVRFGAY